VFPKSFHYSAYFSMIWKIWKKCEMIWIIWKKSKLNSEKIWKIQKKIVKWYGKYG
jgi:hypothetical protein